MPEFAAPFFERGIAWPPPLPLVRTVTATADMASLLSIAGAFETHTVPIFGRTLYWLALLLVARLTAFSVETTGRHFLRSLNLRLPV